MLLTIHLLYPVVDVSTQDGDGGECNVTVRNPNTLTPAGGALPNGITDVRFHCSCDRDDGTLRNTRWYDPSGTKLGTSSTNNIPYHILQNGNTEAVLVIPTFTESYAGIYTCGGNFASNPPPPTATINLTICKLQSIIFI